MLQISRHLSKSEQQRGRGPGAPTALAVHSKYTAVGTAKGLVLVFDHMQAVFAVLGVAAAASAAAAASSTSTGDSSGSSSAEAITALDMERLRASHTVGLCQGSCAQDSAGCARLRSHCRYVACAYPLYVHVYTHASSTLWFAA
jgi:hypothetical protein